MRHESSFHTKPFLCSWYALRWLLLQADTANIGTQSFARLKSEEPLAGMTLAA
jgi:hypothetical protein